MVKNERHLINIQPVIKQKHKSEICSQYEDREKQKKLLF